MRRTGRQPGAPWPSRTGERSGRGGAEILYGVNPVREALSAGQARVLELDLLERPAGRLAELAELGQGRGIPILWRTRAELDALAGGGVHQGAVALTRPRPAADLEDLLGRAATAGEDPLVVILDGIEDPQNLGAIARSAEVFGAHGLVVPRRRSAPLSAAAAKAAAGAFEHLPLAPVANLAAAMEELKRGGLWIYAADAKAGAAPWEVDLSGPLALVIGSEGKGARRLTLERSDGLLRLPVSGRIASLNASAAAAALLYEVRRQRSLKRRGG